VRTCSKLRCEAPAATTVVLRYESREILIRGLTEKHDATLLDLCEEHAGRLTPPLGWAVRDDRSRVSASST
jgi:Protein of unknown function (DUF3499)